MVKYAVTLYDSPAALEAGIEAVDNDVEISAVYMPDNIRHKYGLIQGAKLGLTGDALDVNIKSTDVQQGWEYSGSGAPTSTPVPPTGVVPRYYDYTNHTTYVWADAAWREYLGIIDGGTL